MSVLDSATWKSHDSHACMEPQSRETRPLKEGPTRGAGGPRRECRESTNPQHKHAAWTMLGVWFASSHDFWFKGELDSLG